MSKKDSSLLHRFLGQPLLQFLVLAAVLFGLYLFFGGSTGEEEKKIVVSARQIELLSALWEKQWRRPPMPEELQGLVQSFIREEVLYREALAMGLDQDDTVVRRRLAQKIEFLAQDLMAQVMPSEAELRAFYEEHPEIFEEPGRISFSHVYINLDQHGEESLGFAESLLAELGSGADPRQLGDRFMLQRDYLRKSADEVARHFGSQFAAEVFELSVGEWQGPLQSGYGLHLVLVERKEEAFLPPLEEVREEVNDEFVSFRRRELNETFYNRLREGYEILIEEPQPGDQVGPD
jgi:hypothetical protein